MFLQFLHHAQASDDHRMHLLLVYNELYGYIRALQFNIDAVKVVNYIGQITQKKQELQ